MLLRPLVLGPIRGQRLRFTSLHLTLAVYDSVVRELRSRARKNTFAQPSDSGGGSRSKELEVALIVDR